MRLSARVLSLALATTAPSVLAQAAPAAATQPLLPPAGLYYRYWPLQLVQWLGPELPYSMIVLYADNRPKTPSYDVAFIDRASGKETHYANKPELLAEDKAKGYDAYPTRMQFDQPDAPGKGAQYLLRFNTEKEQPVVWQFVQLTDISDQGSGVTPVDAPFPILLYREQGALAGEGTALKIGNVTSTADVWKDYAQPPYFVPYHGAITEGAHILSIPPLQSSWTDAQPATLAEGSSWQLVSARGSAYDAHADALHSGALTLTLTDQAHGTATTLEAAQTAAGWAVSRVRLGPTGAKAEHTLQLSFAPALAPGAESRFDITAGKKTKLASGSVQTGRSQAGFEEKWTMSSPDWARGKTSTATTGVGPGAKE